MKYMRGRVTSSSVDREPTPHLQGPYEMPALVVPRSVMSRLTPDPDRFLGVRMSGEDAVCGLLSSFVGQVVARMDKLPDRWRAHRRQRPPLWAAC